MQWPFIPIKLWQLLSVVIIVLLNGCSSTPVEPTPSPSPQLPVATTEPPVIDTATYHLVERGETLYGIATRYGRNYKDVARWNNIAPPYELNPGQRLRIDGSSSSDENVPSAPYTPGIAVVPEAPPVSQPIFSPSAPKPPSAPEGIHIVQAGETLSVIAKQYGYSYRDIAAWNGIESPYALNIGQELMVSQPSDWKPDSMPLVVQKPVTRPTTPTPASPSTQPTPSPADSNEDEHIVLPGDTLYKIAKHYGYSLADLAIWNGLESPYNLLIGQKLRVAPPDANTVLPPTPAPSPATTPAVINVPQGSDNSDYHIVAYGDTLYNISRSYGYSVSQIAKWNNLEQPYSLSLGQKLRVMPPSMMTPDLTPTPNKDYLRPAKLGTSPRYHVVQAGETLSSIAKKYGISFKDLAKWNGIGSPYTVYPGLKLTVSSP